MIRRFLFRLAGMALIGLLINAQAYAGVVFNVKDYGALGNGTTLDTPAINKAIEAAAEAGGGTVYFPSGTYLCFSIHLKSNVTLYLAQGSTIMAADPNKVKGGYDPAEPNKWHMYQDYGHSHFHDSLIWGVNLHDISILGPGLIDGKGLVRWDSKKQGVGNKAIALKLCHNVIMRDFSILMGGHFGILATGVDNLTIDNLKIDTNRDGMDIDACHNVRVSNCSVNSPFDDGICLKSSYALGYARATEDVTISDCQVTGYDPGTFLNGTYKETLKEAPDHHGMTGRIKFGTESNGGFKNITITNCVFEHCRGLALETVDGGLLEDVTIDNITMRDLTSAPIFLRLGARMRGPKGTPIGQLKRINISNVVVYDADPRYASLICGIKGHDIEDVSLNNIRIVYRGGGTKADAKIVPPEMPQGYPEPSMFGEIPAYGFYLRHVKGVEFSNINISYEKQDERPAFVMKDVSDVELHDIKSEHAPDVPTFVLKDVRNFSVRHSDSVPDTKVKETELKSF